MCHHIFCKFSGTVGFCQVPLRHQDTRCMPVQGSAFYLSGAALVIVGWTIVGLGVEAYGFWLLFCEFLPTVLQFSRRVPFMSKVLDMPVLKVVSCNALLLHKAGTSPARKVGCLSGYFCLHRMSAVDSSSMHCTLWNNYLCEKPQLVVCPSLTV